MKKSILFSILGVLILLTPLVFTSCISDDSKAPAKPIVSTTDQEQNTAITSLTGKVATAEAKVTAVEAKVAALPAGQVTKQQYDEAVARIAALESSNTQLKADVAVLKAGTPTTPITPTTPTTTGQVTVTTNPASIQTFSSNQMCYTMRISNGTNQWIYAKPIVTFNTTQTVVVSAVEISASWGSYNMTGPTCWNVSPIGASTTAVLCIPINCGASALGEVQLAAGQFVDVLVCVKITSADPRIWTVSHSISTRTI